LEEQADPLPGAERRAFEDLTLPEIAEKYPVMAAVYQQAKASGQLESDARFQSGLQVILDGIAAQIAAH
jgi:predicted DNA-binding protein YlxM (UPF0122 family)